MDRLPDRLMLNGENDAVRAFLAQYGGTKGCSVERMKAHLKRCGFDKCWPEWADYAENHGHLTKAKAQDWLRVLFRLEQDSDVQRPYEDMPTTPPEKRDHFADLRVAGSLMDIVVLVHRDFAEGTYPLYVGEKREQNTAG